MCHADPMLVAANADEALVTEAWPEEQLEVRESARAARRAARRGSPVRKRGRCGREAPVSDRPAGRSSCFGVVVRRLAQLTSDFFGHGSSRRATNYHRRPLSRGATIVAILCSSCRRDIRSNLSWRVAERGARSTVTVVIRSNRFVIVSTCICIFVLICFDFDLILMERKMSGSSRRPCEMGSDAGFASQEKKTEESCRRN